MPTIDPANAPTITSVGKWLPEVTRKIPVKTAALIPPIQIGAIHRESLFSSWNMSAARTAPLNAIEVCPEKNERPASLFSNRVSFR